MTNTPGTFQLRTPRDLLAKLERDLARFERDPADADIAFCFFVTAEHLLDWYLPGRACDKERKSLRDSKQILQIVSHLANGSKHFKVEDKRHTSVNDSHGREFQLRPPAPSGVDVWPTSFLYVDLNDPAAGEFGSPCHAIKLAHAAVEYWRLKLRDSASDCTSQSSLSK